MFAYRIMMQLVLKFILCCIVLLQLLCVFCHKTQNVDQQYHEVMQSSKKLIQPCDKPLKATPAILCVAFFVFRFCLQTDQLGPIIKRNECCIRAQHGKTSQWQCKWKSCRESCKKLRKIFCNHFLLTNNEIFQPVSGRRHAGKS